MKRFNQTSPSGWEVSQFSKTVSNIDKEQIRIKHKNWDCEQIFSYADFKRLKQGGIILPSSLYTGETIKNPFSISSDGFKNQVIAYNSKRQSIYKELEDLVLQWLKSVDEKWIVKK